LFDPPPTTSLPEASTSTGKHTIYYDVFSFTDALRLWPERDVCKGLFWKRCLRGSALNWWITELSDLEKELMKTASIDAISQALISRFKMPSATALRQLSQTHFAYLQIRNGLHISEHLSTCFRLARHADYTSEYHILLATWNTLDGQIKLALGSPPLSSSTKAQFIRKANEQWSSIYELATRFKPQFASGSAATSSIPSKAPFTSSKTPDRPYVNRPGPPKPIDNKAYMANADERAYMTAEGKWAYLEYEDDPAESLNRATDVD